MLSDSQIAHIEKVLNDDWAKSVVKLYEQIRNYRNNFNHAGFNKDTPTPKEIEDKVNEFVDMALEVFSKINMPLCS